MPRKKIITTKEFENNQLTEKEHHFYKTYLNKGIEMIDSMSRRHGKVMQTRMDFRYPQEMRSDGSNTDFSKALQGLSKALNREGYDPQYIGRREQKNQPNQHYHLNLITNAARHESRQRIIEKAERQWGNALGLTQEEVHEKKLVYPCNRDMNGNSRPNGYMLVRGAEDYNATRSAMIRQMSYITKCDFGDTTPSTTRKFFVSQFHKDETMSR